MGWKGERDKGAADQEPRASAEAGCPKSRGGAGPARGTCVVCEPGSQSLVTNRCVGERARVTRCAGHQGLRVGSESRQQRQLHDKRQQAQEVTGGGASWISTWLSKQQAQPQPQQVARRGESLPAGQEAEEEGEEGATSRKGTAVPIGMAGLLGPTHHACTWHTNTPHSTRR